MATLQQLCRYVRYQNISVHAKYLYLVLNSIAAPGETISIDARRLGKMASMVDTTVSKAKRALMKCGLIKVERAIAEDLPTTGRPDKITIIASPNVQEFEVTSEHKTFLSAKKIKQLGYTK